MNESRRSTAHPAAAALAAFGAALLLLAAAPAQEPAGTEVRVEAAAPAQFGPATAKRLSDTGAHLRGLWVHTAAGDTILRNDLAYLAFGASPGQGPALDLRDSAAAALRSGALLDIAPSAASPEALQFFGPALGGQSELRHDVARVERRANPDGSAVVTVTATDPRNPGVSITTEYLMAPDVPGTLATTTITNEGDDRTEVEILPADRILWGAMAPFIPGQGWAPAVVRREGRVEFVMARHFDTWVLVAPEAGEAWYEQVNGVATMAYGEAGHLEPGESRVFRRWILTASQDPSDLFSHVVFRRPGAQFGTLVGRVVERRQAPDGSVIDGAPGSNIEVRITPLRRDDWTSEQLAERENRPYLLATTNARGEFDMLLPVGEYFVFAAPYARGAERPTFATRIREGRVTVEEFGVSPPTTLEYRIVDAETGELVPGKLTIEALRGTLALDHGFPGGALAANTVLSTYGAGSIPIAPGAYRIVASRGPEFDIAEQRVRVSAPQGADPGGAEVVFEVRRAFETPGWISADIGVRTNATPSSRVLPQVRVISAVAEGLDWIVTGDDGVATDLASHIRDMRLERFLAASPGFRFSGHREPHMGDFLMFPVDACSTGSDIDLSLLLEARDSRELLELMRALCPEAAILVSRPTWPVTGFLTLFGYDRERGLMPDRDWPKDFDAFQVWEGKRQGAVTPNYAAYHAVLRTGARPAIFANTDSHGTYNEEVGYPRVYIASEHDSPADLDPVALARAVKRGQVLVTNGPFIRLQANGQPIGSIIEPRDGVVELDLEVFAANWVDARTIAINLNGQFVRQIILPPGRETRRGGRVYPRSEEEATTPIRIRVDRDSVLDVVVQGAPGSNMDPVNPFSPTLLASGIERGQYALAISGPIFIDADGDGLVTLEAPDQMPGLPELADPDDPPF